jgi:ribose transport system substrate-binding protein
VTAVHRRRVTSAVLVAGVAALVAAGCGNSDDSSTSSGSASSASTAAASATPVKIDWGPYCGTACQEALTLKAPADSIKCKVGFPLAATSFPYGAAMKTKTAEAAEKYFPNMDLQIIDGQGDTTKQSNDVDTLIAKGVDVMLINALEAKALAPAVKRAVDAGVKVVSVDRAVDTPVLTTIKADDFTLGQGDAKYIVEQLKGKGNVVEIAGTSGASPTIDRHAGFESVIKENPGIKVIASQAGDYDRGQGLKVMEDLLQRFPSGQIDAVFAHADNMSLGAIQAIKAAGRQDEMVVAGADGQDSAFTAIAAGDYGATVVYPLIVPMDVVAAAKACADEPMPKDIKLDAPLVTKENVDKYKGTNFAG